MKLLSWIILLPLIIVMIAFAIANREIVALQFDPLPFALELPLYLAALGFILVGIFVGAAAVHGGLRRWRGLARARARDVARLEAELAARARTKGLEAAAPATIVSDAA